MNSLDEAYLQVRSFKGASFREQISTLETSLSGTDREICQNFLPGQGISLDLLRSALILKRASSQINEVVHAVGILLALPLILEGNETIQFLSLAAGNTGKPFDVETNLRIAEFKFIDWKGGAEAIRQNQLFKDFYQLSEYTSSKEKYLYVVGADIPRKFLQRNRALKSVLSHQNKLWNEFQEKYGNRFKTVGEYYSYRKNVVHLVDLLKIIPLLSFGIDTEEAYSK